MPSECWLRASFGSVFKLTHMGHGPVGGMVEVHDVAELRQLVVRA
jgi:hypothetical protein